MDVDLGDGYRLRNATEADRPALEMVCLKTGDSGKDATAREDDPRLLGLIYAVPYQVFAPEFAFVIDGPDGVVGYVLGVSDTEAYDRWAVTEWFPQVARTLDDPGPDKATWQGSDWARRAIHHPSFTHLEALRPYPAHGHIDLLESVQGRGFGRKALDHLTAAIAASGAKGLHLAVSPTNTGALAFYERVGFRRLTGGDVPRGAVYMVKEL